MRATRSYASALILTCAGVAVLTAQSAPTAIVAPQEILEGLPADGSRWLTFGGDYANQRHSPLTQIAPSDRKSVV